jgi:YNFM family putative membrane transporter
VVPLVGRLIERLGRRRLVIICIGTWLGGLALTLAPSLPAIVAGLAIAAASGMVCQTVATSFLAVVARQARSSAVGLYVTFYYIGGSIGGVLPGLVWATAGWAGCLAMVAVVLLAAAALVMRFWAPSALTEAANPA